MSTPSDDVIWDLKPFNPPKWGDIRIFSNAENELLFELYMLDDWTPPNAVANANFIDAIVDIYGIPFHAFPELSMYCRVVSQTAKEEMHKPVTRDHKLITQGWVPVRAGTYWANPKFGIEAPAKQAVQIMETVQGSRKLTDAVTYVGTKEIVAMWGRSGSQAHVFLDDLRACFVSQEHLYSPVGIWLDSTVSVNTSSVAPGYKGQIRLRRLHIDSYKPVDLTLTFIGDRVLLQYDLPVYTHRNGKGGKELIAEISTQVQSRFPETFPGVLQYCELGAALACISAMKGESQ